MKGGILFLLILIFSISLVIANENKSSCVEFEEITEDGYVGKCDLYLNEHIYFSGVNAGIEYIYEDSVKLIINGESFRSFANGDEFILSVSESKNVNVKIHEIWYSEKVSGVTFYYNISDENLLDSFCYNNNCVFYVNDKLYFGDEEVDFFSIEDSNKSCYDLSFRINREMEDLEDVCVNDTVNVGSFDFKFLRMSDSKEMVFFEHNFEWNNNSCEESDFDGFYEKGSILGFYEKDNFTYGARDLSPYYFEDYCYSLKPVLVEFYCNSGYIESKIVNCDKCIDGTCVNFTEEEYLEIERLENLGKKDFSSIVICESGCLLNESCYSYGYNLSGEICSKDGWVSFEEDVEKVSFFRRFFGWFGKIFN